MRWWLETNEYDLLENNFSSSDFESTQDRHNKSKLSYNIYGTGELDYNSFAIGHTSSEVNASLISNPMTQISLTINHGEIINHDYYEFRINSGGEIDIKKAGYRIVGLEVKIYQNYDNINIYSHNYSTHEETKLHEYQTHGNKNIVYKTLSIDEEHVIIRLDEDKYVQFYYISVLLAPNP